jgi:hypothetical protein
LLSRGRQDLDTSCRGDENHRGAPDEKTALHGTHCHSYVFFETSRIANRAEPAIENEITAIGYKRLLAGIVAPHWGAPKPGEDICRNLPPKLRYFDRYWRVLAKTLDELFLVYDDGKPIARRGDDLLPQQSASQSLDQIERAELYFVGSVDGQIEALMLGKGCDRYAEPARVLGGPLGGRNADDA